MVPFAPDRVWVLRTEQHSIPAAEHPDTCHVKFAAGHWAMYCKFVIVVEQSHNKLLSDTNLHSQHRCRQLALLHVAPGVELLAHADEE